MVLFFIFYVAATFIDILFRSPQNIFRYLFFRESLTMDSFFFFMKIFAIIKTIRKQTTHFFHLSINCSRILSAISVIRLAVLANIIFFFQIFQPPVLLLYQFFSFSIVFRVQATNKPFSHCFVFFLCEGNELLIQVFF